MTLARTLPIRIFFVAALLFLSGCATMNLDYEEPTIELVSFKALPANGFEQNFEIGLKLTNPNDFELPFNGISYQLSVAGEALAHGVAANIPTATAYGESRFVVPVSTSLMGGFKVIRALMNSKGQDISYQLKAKLDIDIPFMPKLTVIQDGIIPLGQKPQ
ncbi:LEA type 2 family protein [Colwellia psychrerythraea]|jgi:LEA14-like dessication related protein|uniref:Putative lipoprotein n=1 Tax=Colwellia psychrerythraea (strain 34H / ATCC BAA-681) TaxID=167879 RepID=Q487S4_COLP3|nr:LEA type 2 family protein [Colwellia psychrerythraea]AAZ25028.1 putative lipoprotein [Colwellia psychrerythraea 34H]